jgi:hypothetical protein
MNAHALYFLKRGGVPIYHKYFSAIIDNTEPALISSFLHAIMDFSRAVVRKELNVVDIGDLRFTFYNPDGANNDDLTFIIITDVGMSVLLVREWVKQIARVFFQAYPMHTCNDIDCMIESPDIDAAIKQIIESNAGQSSDALASIKDVFELELAAGEVVGGAMFTLKGEILYNSLSRTHLNQALKEVEIRSQSETLTLKTKLPKLIWQAGNSLLFSQVVHSDRFSQPVVVNLLFDNLKTSNLGMADFVLEYVVKKLQPLL